MKKIQRFGMNVCQPHQRKIPIESNLNLFYCEIVLRRNYFNTDLET